jgi:hypothetical protein
MSVENKGAVRFAASTSGGDLDFDGYEVMVDNGRTLPLRIDGEVIFGGLDPGMHDAQLQGIAANCDASSPGVTRFEVKPYETTQVHFQITCFPTGVQVVTTVEGLDAGMFYTIYLDEALRPEQVDVGSDKLITGLPPGPHVIRLGNVPGNCELEPASRTVEVPFRTMVTVEFTSRCIAAYGAIRIDVETTGEDLDLDAYVVTLGGNQTVGVPVNGTGTRDDVLPGTHEVRLTDVAPNCVVAGGESQTAVVTAGKVSRDTSRHAFTVSCHREWDLAFTRDGVVMVSNAEGTIMDAGPQGTRPAWSPDGRRLAFECSSICVLDLDSGSLVAITYGHLHDGPAWSPDGSRIAFVARHCTYQYYYDYVCEFEGIYRSTLDGSSTLRIPSGSVTDARDPAWSPDGNTIAFACSLGSSSQLCAVSLDGTGFRSLHASGGWSGEPAWSPDGSRLVFASTSYGSRELLTVKPDGTDLRRFTPPLAGWSPHWTRDGRILFASQLGLSSVNADGTGLQRITSVPKDSMPALRPLP